MPIRFAAVFLATALLLSAGVIDVSTSSSWSVDAGAGPWTAYELRGGYIGFTSDGYSTGSHAPGLDLDAWSGYWTASYQFFLPPEATDIRLNILGIEADDRVALLFNGHLLAFEALHASGAGVFALTDGVYTAANFPAFSPFVESNQSYFNVGGQNTLVAIVNNTVSPSTTGNLTGLSPENGSELFISGYVDFVETPEPTAALMLGSGVALLLVSRWFSRRRTES